MEKMDTILLIHMEELSSFRQFIHIFEDKGFRIMEAEDMDKAYQILGSHSVDMIAIDLDIGYHEAFKFCYRIKHNKNFKNIFVMAFTDAHERFKIYLNARTKSEKEWLNVDLLVHKPISTKNIYRLLKREIAILEGIDTTKLDSAIDYVNFM